MKRSRKVLEQKISQAKSQNKKAVAYYQLGLFHDNNNREVEAIPNYKRALRLGLPRQLRAQALAWLASSLYKTGDSAEARLNINKALFMANDKKLKEFLERLQVKC